MGEIPDVLTRRTVFSYCGKMVGHYPVCGWLRVATAVIKRRANYVTEGWDDVIVDEEVSKFLQETVDEVKGATRQEDDGMLQEKRREFGWMLALWLLAS